MRVLRIIGAMVSFGLAAYLFVPAGLALWRYWRFFRSGDDEQTYYLVARSGGHELTGWQIWAYLGGLALISLLLAGFGFYLLCPGKSTTSDDS